MAIILNRIIASIIDAFDFLLSVLQTDRSRHEVKTACVSLKGPSQSVKVFFSYAWIFYVHCSIFGLTTFLLKSLKHIS